MPAAPISQIVLLLAAEGDFSGPEAVEALGLDLQAELADADVTRVDQVRVGDAPEGARGLEILGACAFIITAVQTGEALAKVVAAIRRVVTRYAQNRNPVRVSIGGIDVELADADDRTVRQIVQALLALPAQAATGVRDALIIANARYDDPGLAQLRAPGHDADALVRVLGNPGIGGFNVELLMDADERTIRRRIASFFANRDRDDLLLLHFSCHGVKDTRGRLHLACRDTDLSVLGATSVPASFVNDVLAETQSRRVVLILDCCYSGAFARGAVVRSGNEVQIADEFGAGSGRIVLTASSATEYAFEGTDLARVDAQPSVFTSALVNGLATGAADLDADGEISIDELYDYTYRKVRQATPGQAPMKWSFGVEGSLVVARSVRPAALPESIVDDLASDRVVLRLEAVRALAQLLRGGKPGMRTAALAALADLSATDDSVQVRRSAGAALAGDGPADTPVATEHRHDPTGPASTPDRPAPPQPVSTPEHPKRSTPAGRPVPAQPQLEAHPTQPVAHPARPVAGGTPPEASTTGRSHSLSIAAGLLVCSSVLLYAMGVYGVAEASFAEGWYHDLIWVAQLAGAGLLLATRDTRWGGLLLGVLAWAWVDLALVLHSGTQDYFQDAWGFLITADVAAIVAQVCLVAALMRERGTQTAPVTRARVLTAALLACLAIGTSLLLMPLLFEAWSLDTGEGAAVRAITAVACAAVIPATILVAPSGRGAALVPAGWLLGGAELAVFTAWINLSSDGISETNRNKVIWLCTLLILTTAAATTSSARLRHTERRGTP